MCRSSTSFPRSATPRVRANGSSFRPASTGARKVTRSRRALWRRPCATPHDPRHPPPRRSHGPDSAPDSDSRAGRERRPGGRLIQKRLLREAPLVVVLPPREEAIALLLRRRVDPHDGARPVSYTHLTLPTIY